MRRFLLAFVAVPFGIAGAIGCAGQCDSTQSQGAPAGTSSVSSRPVPAPSAAGQPSAEALVELEPRVLLRLAKSAYHAQVAMDDEAVYVLVPGAAHRLVVGQQPQRIALESGFEATVTEGSFLHWAQGGLWKTPKRGGKARRIGAVPHRPQRIVSSGSAFAWLDRSEAGRSTIQMLDDEKPRIVHESPGRIDAATMLGDWVFFVEQGGSTWRLGRVPIDGGKPTFSTVRKTRTPAMLAAFDDAIYFYDGLGSGVRRLAADFLREDVLVKDFVCSPLAVSERVYCSQVQGLFELAGDGGSPTLLTRNEKKLVAAVVAGSRGVAWISEVGEEQLVVRMLPRAAASSR